MKENERVERFEKKKKNFSYKKLQTYISSQHRCIMGNLSLKIQTRDDTWSATAAHYLNMQSNKLPHTTKAAQLQRIMGKQSLSHMRTNMQMQMTTTPSNLLDQTTKALEPNHSEPKSSSSSLQSR